MAEQILAHKYGRSDKAYREAYGCYGEAQLRVSKMESGGLGNTWQEIDEEQSEKYESKSEALWDKSEDTGKVTERRGEG